MRLSAVISVFSIVFVLASIMVPCATASIEVRDGSGAMWRQLSRKASSMRLNGDYDGARNTYEEAIQALGKDDAAIDQRFDLMLFQVECYSRARKFNEARALLNQLEAKVKKKEYFDVMIPARFLRRKASVELSAGNRQEGLQLMRQLLKIQQAHFHRDSGAVISTLKFLLREEQKDKNYPAVVEILRYWRPEILAKKVPLGLDAVCEHSLSCLAIGFHEAMVAKDMRKAFAFWQAMAEFDTDVDKQVLQLAAYLNTALADKKVAEAELGVNPLTFLLAASEKLPFTPARARAQMEGHASLSWYYSQTGSIELQRREMEMILKDGMQIKEPLTMVDSIRLCEADLELAGLDSANPAKLKLVEERLSHALKVRDSLLKNPDASPELRRHANWQHIRVHFHFAHAYLDNKQAEKASESLKTLRADSLRQFPDSDMRAARLNLMTAKLFVDKKDMAKAKQHLQIAKNLMDSRPIPPKFKDDIVPLYDSLKNQLN